MVLCIPPVRVQLKEDVLSAVSGGPISCVGSEGVDVTALSKALLEHKVQSLTKPLCIYKEEIIIHFLSGANNYCLNLLSQFIILVHLIS